MRKVFWIILVVIILFSCSDSNDTPEPVEYEDVSEEVIFNTPGIHFFSIDAQEISADIMLVAGGGGGGHGGIESTLYTGPGGGGGGAGEHVEMQLIHLNKGDYFIIIGKGGLFAPDEFANKASNGGKSVIGVIQSDTLFSVQGGQGGATPEEGQTGGLGGTGFPDGEQGKGSSGIPIGGVNLTIPGGDGGSGGSNGFGYGSGGQGGNGSGIETGTSYDPTAGQSGSSGYCKILWKGKRVKQ